MNKTKSKQYGLSDAVIEKINTVFSHYPSISKVTLYGSRAKDTYKDGSDIDLSIYAEELDISTLHQIELELDDLLLAYKVDLNIYNKLKNESLKAHIQRVGKPFYKRNSSLS